jgi:30S ribosomal protein S31
MGKGDKKTAKGKRYAGSYGNARSHTTKTVAAAKTVAKPAAKKAAPAAKKAPAKKPAA